MNQAHIATPDFKKSAPSPKTELPFTTLALADRVSHVSRSERKRCKRNLQQSFERSLKEVVEESAEETDDETFAQRHSALEEEEVRKYSAPIPEGAAAKPSWERRWSKLPSNANVSIDGTLIHLDSVDLVNFLPEHKDLLKRYLTFFSLKKESAFKDVHLAIEDVKEEV